MTTVDAKGIIRYEASDSASPLHTALNLGLDSVSNALDTPGYLTSAGVHTVANLSGLNALRTQLNNAGYTGAVYAHRTDLGELWYHSGTGGSWGAYAPPIPIGWARDLTGELTYTSPVTTNTWISNRITIPAEPFAKTVTSSVTLYGVAPLGTQWDLVVTSENLLVSGGTRARFTPGAGPVSANVTYTQTVPANTVSYVRVGVLYNGAHSGNLTLSNSVEYRNWHVSVQPTK